jgi:hypothetical protein
VDYYLVNVNGIKGFYFCIKVASLFIPDSSTGYIPIIPGSSTGNIPDSSTGYIPIIPGSSTGNIPDSSTGNIPIIPCRIITGYIPDSISTVYNPCFIIMVSCRLNSRVGIRFL